MKKKLKVINIGIMGCADIAKRSVIPSINLLKNFKLAAVASRNAVKAKKFAKLFNCKAVKGYENLLKLNDIDAIYMPLPSGIHEKWIIKCLNAGKHVLSEKSLAYNLVSAKKMVALAKKNKLVLMENYMFQYHSQHKFVLKMLQNKIIGNIRIFRANFGFPPLQKNNFRYNDKIGGGALLDVAGYVVRVVHFILGNDFIVKASNLYISPLSRTNIYGSAFLTNDKGITAQIGFGMDNFYQCNYEIWGSLGKIVVEKAFTPGPSFKPKIILEKKDKIKEYILDADNHFDGSLNNFYKTIVMKNQNKLYQQIILQSKTLDDIKKYSKY